MQSDRTTHLNSTSLKFQLVIFLLYDVQIISATLFVTSLVSRPSKLYGIDMDAYSNTSIRFLIILSRCNEIQNAVNKKYD
jgi:hypothetical protein